jgi:hypothetical protein
MRTHRFGQKIKLPATIAIKHQLRKLMFEDSIKKAEAEARAEAMRGQLREETRSLAGEHLLGVAQLANRRGDRASEASRFEEAGPSRGRADVFNC